ncbi:hypothetical protein AB835_11805 [Candidatus Endobugula sertula]|uniref:Uncharacterized protein n=1 Tax=Candidatus Endobugula sertula TaxID=62101 RepID=A0A1D2QMR8_9GAMM|nr:hypothetical protein AB835_11805 [Candidatus Endobugula sertula]
MWPVHQTLIAFQKARKLMIYGLFYCLQLLSLSHFVPPGRKKITLIALEIKSISCLPDKNQIKTFDGNGY